MGTVHLYWIITGPSFAVCGLISLMSSNHNKTPTALIHVFFTAMFLVLPAALILVLYSYSSCCSNLCIVLSGALQ
jgi:hypothetical protein